MINLLIGQGTPLIAFLGIMFAFVGTCFFTAKCSKYLPKDMGRQFAVDGKLSAGKPRGAGIIFIFVFTAAALLFSEITIEFVIYIALVVVEMLTGFLDDASDKPWSEVKKGILDLAVSVIGAVTYVYFNTSTITLAIFDVTVTLPPVVYVILAVALIWASINVTNCSDGVDGLSGTLTLVTLVSIYVLSTILKEQDTFPYMILLFCVCILGYLWYNATPSILLMGDAGSRAMGVFIAFAVMKTGSPFLYLLVAVVMILDGGLGLLKVALLRTTRIHILKNIRTPLHDQARKVNGWSNTQTVFRFAIIQIVICACTVYLVLI